MDSNQLQPENTINAIALMVFNKLNEDILDKDGYIGKIKQIYKGFNNLINHYYVKIGIERGVSLYKESL